MKKENILDYNDFLWCWQISFYDGMLSSIAFYKDTPVFVSFEDSDEERFIIAKAKDEDGELFCFPRVFNVYALKNEDFIELFRRNLLWKKFVGIHNEMMPDSTTKVFLGKTQPETEWSKYPYWNDPLKIDKSNFLGKITLKNTDPHKAECMNDISKENIYDYFTKEQIEELEKKYYVSFNGGILSLGLKNIYISKPILENEENAQDN